MKRTIFINILIFIILSFFNLNAIGADLSQECSSYNFIMATSVVCIENKSHNISEIGDELNNLIPRVINYCSKIFRDYEFISLFQQTRALNASIDQKTCLKMINAFKLLNNKFGLQSDYLDKYIVEFGGVINQKQSNPSKDSDNMNLDNHENINKNSKNYKKFRGIITEHRSENGLQFIMIDENGNIILELGSPDNYRYNARVQECLYYAQENKIPVILEGIIKNEVNGKYIFDIPKMNCITIN